jgi:hypothetical protein
MPPPLTTIEAGQGLSESFLTLFAENIPFYGVARSENPRPDGARVSTVSPPHACVPSLAVSRDQASQILVRKPLISLVKRDRPAASRLTIGLAEDRGDGTAVRTPQASAAEADLNRIRGRPMEPDPAVTERVTNRSAGRAAHRIMVREAERPPLLID